MIFLKKIAIFFFDCLDKYIHQKKIISNLEKINTKIDIIFDVGSHKGTYTDLFLKNFNISKSFIFEPQKDIFHYIKKKYKKLIYVDVINKFNNINILSDRINTIPYEILTSLGNRYKRKYI